MRAGMAPRPRCIRQVSLWEAELDPSMGREQDDRVTLHSPQPHGLGPGLGPDDLCILQAQNEGRAAASRGWQRELGRARGRVPGL